MQGAPSGKSVGHGLCGLVLNECTDAGRNLLCPQPSGGEACIGNYYRQNKRCEGPESTHICCIQGNPMPSTCRDQKQCAECLPVGGWCHLFLSGEHAQKAFDLGLPHFARVSKPIMDASRPQHKRLGPIDISLLGL